MNGILLAESIGIEFAHIYEACDNAVAYANARFMEEGLIPSLYMEADGEKRSGGLVGFLGDMLRSISKMLSDAGKKIKSALFGSKVNEDVKNEKVNGYDAGILAKFMNGYYKDASDVLKKAKKGEISVEEARKFTSEKDKLMSGISTAVMTVGSLFATMQVNDKFINKWKSEIDDLCATITIDDNGKKVNVADRASEKMAYSLNKDTKNKIADEAVTVITNHMQKTSKFGLKAMEDNIKILFAKNYIRAKLDKGELELKDNKAAAQARKDAKAKTKATDKMVDTLDTLKGNIERNKADRERQRESDLADSARLAKAKNDFDPNSDEYVDEEDLKGKVYIGKDDRKAKTEERKSAVKSGFKKVKRWADRNFK